MTASRATRFLPLTVTHLARDTRDGLIVTLAPRPEDREAFAFLQGQYLTFRRVLEGEELRRSYSICSGIDDGALRVGIKRVEGGAFSNWVHEALKVGDEIEAMPPMGRFHSPLAPDTQRHYLTFAAGSGITPILSIIKTLLAREPQARVTLVYANRQISTIMFREELEDLKNLYLGRLSILHILGQDGQEIDLFTGRLDAEKLDALYAAWIDLDTVDLAFICGPETLMQTIAASLRKHGLSEEQIKFELFAAAQQGRLPQRAVSASRESGGEIAASVTLDGMTRSFKMPQRGQTLLEAALAQNLDAPFSCRAGVCSTCRARVTEGETEMAVNHALDDDEVRRGYVLTCQCYPLSDKVSFTYDH